MSTIIKGVNQVTAETAIRFEDVLGLMLHRTGHLFIRQQTPVINAIRAHLTGSSGRPRNHEAAHYTFFHVSVPL